MAQIALENLTTTWVEFSDIETPTPDTEYWIQNRGADFLLACEGSALHFPAAMQGRITANWGGTSTTVAYDL